MNKKTKTILSLGVFAISVGLTLLPLFFWKAPPSGSWENFFHSLCSDQLLLVLGIDGLLRAKRQKAERGYAQPGPFLFWVMVAFFCLLLVRNFWILIS